MGWIEYETGSGGQLTLKIIDTTGSHEFAAMRSLYIRGSDAFILVCSVDDPQSMREVESIFAEIEERNEKVAFFSI
jgi:GTPase SAR1 family protein